MKKRNTIQGQLVLNAVSHLANHPTAEDVYNYVSTIHPNISKGTVYRNLNSLSEEGLLLKISVPDAADRFDQTTRKHYHIKCMECGDFQDIDMPYDENLDEKAAQVSGYHIFSHEVIFKGICEKCCEKTKIKND